MRVPKPKHLVTAATASYLANCALGTGVATGLVTTGSAHWVHHALYLSHVHPRRRGCQLAVVEPEHEPGWMLLPAAAPLAVDPLRGNSHRAAHPLIALAAAPFFADEPDRAWR